MISVREAKATGTTGTTRMRRWGLICIASMALFACDTIETTSNDDYLVVDGTRSKPGSYATIQEAIDAAPAGTTIVVLPGIYSGPGNADLDFRGKAITLRSEEPGNATCRRHTIIDASGHAGIARFQSDEGPDTVFRGFTLLSGELDARTGRRGVPGFYSMSERARPSIVDMEIGSVRVGKRVSNARSPLPLAGADTVTRSSSRTTTLAATAAAPPIEPEGASRWTGRDPFQQPVRTTRYHGSGDVDLDGDVDDDDAALADAMASGALQSEIMADVDADGHVTAADGLAIRSVRNGGSLPGWWDRLSTRAQRNDWLDRILALDPTNERPYSYPWFQCGGFAMQLSYRSIGWLGEATDLGTDAGRTLYDVPTYQVSVTAPDYGHSINAVLVGDNPLNFDDWRFIEPQTDLTAEPGMWDMPIGSTVTIAAIDGPSFGGGGSNPRTWLVFTVDELGGHLRQVTDGFTTTRPVPGQELLDNAESFFNPRMISGGKILYESQRHDLTRNTDVHLGLASSVAAPTGKALVGLTRDVHLLDALTDPSGSVHLLWKSTEPNVYYARLAPGQNGLSAQQLVFVSDQDIPRGRLLLTRNGQLHAFWYLRNVNSYSVHESGIFWARLANQEWSTPEVVVESSAARALTLYSSTNALTDRNPSRYFFDVAERGGAIELAFVAQTSADRELLRMTHDGAWSTPEVVFSGNVQGLRIAADGKANLHLVYWWNADYGQRGALSHGVHDGATWSAHVQLEPSGASSPDLLVLPNGTLYLTWERQASDRIVPMLRAYDGGWQSERVLPSDALSNAWYPTLAYDTNAGTLGVTWSERSGTKASLALATVSLACVPNCGIRNCGNDGCGGSCGTCGAERICSAEGQCQVAPSCTDGLQNQGETGVDCGGPCAPCSTSQCTCPRGCNDMVDASTPFWRDGSDDRCYHFGSSLGAYVNSWNAQEVNLNGIDITNRYVSVGNYPAPVGGGYYLYFRSAVPWGHFEVRN